MLSSFTLERTPDPLRRGRVGDVSPTGWLPPDHRLSVRGGVRRWSGQARGSRRRPDFLRLPVRSQQKLGGSLTPVEVGATPRRSEVKVRGVAAISLFAVALILVPAVPSYAGRHGGHGGHGFHGHHGFHSHFHGHGAIVVGPSFWRDPWWYYPPPYYAYAPPPVIVQEPPVYVEPPAPPQSYWYYCRSARAWAVPRSENRTASRRPAARSSSRARRSSSSALAAALGSPRA